jgi:flavin-dependent dehydrogenase
MFDVIVIGAGLAGSVAVRQLASDGWWMALLEKQKLPLDELTKVE